SDGALASDAARASVSAPERGSARGRAASAGASRAGQGWGSGRASALGSEAGEALGPAPRSVLRPVGSRRARVRELQGRPRRSRHVRSKALLLGGLGLDADLVVLAVYLEIDDVAIGLPLERGGVPRDLPGEGFEGGLLRVPDPVLGLDEIL